MVLRLLEVALPDNISGRWKSSLRKKP